MTPRALAEEIRKLRSATPVTTSFEQALFSLGLLDEVKEKRKYATQKEHWLRWLSQYDGPGHYGRKIHGGRSAKFAYNHIVCAPMLLWLAEASGLESTRIQEAKRAALAGKRSLPSMCSALRKAIPWKVVEERLIG